MRREVWWVLRIAVAMCFVGHGIFGVMRKEEWLPLFAAVGIPVSAAWHLMPLIGSVDIVVGIVTLVSPRRVALLYATGWALWTAMLRPIAGLSPWEMIERAGNFGVPLAFLLAVGAGRTVGEWWAPIRLDSPSPTETRRRLVIATLAATTALLFIGHGALALEQKPLLQSHLAAAGLAAAWLVPLGWLEIAAGAAVVLPIGTEPLLPAYVVWKLATEGLFLAAGSPVWELVERGGSYAAPLALWLLRRPRLSPIPSSEGIRP